MFAVGMSGGTAKMGLALWVALHWLLLWHAELMGLEWVDWFVRIDFIMRP